MRPVDRGTSPITGDFDNYRDSLRYLVGRLGRYCSYCERLIATNLAVEHIQPKGLTVYKRLAGSWNNFLLACVNCNSTKKDKDVQLDQHFLPDRDNTFAAFNYTLDGQVVPSPSLTDEQTVIAKSTLSLTGLDKPVSEVTDENGKLVAIDRVHQRMEVRLIADEALGRLRVRPTLTLLREQIVATALANGFFSIWMDVFIDDEDMRRRFIETFPGTSQDCFDERTRPVSPRPANSLNHSGKI